MKIITLLFLCMLSLNLSTLFYAQNFAILNANEIEVKTTNNHTLFIQATSTPEYYRFPSNFASPPIYSSLLTISSYDSTTNWQRILPLQFGCDFYCYDFYPGPLSLDGSRERVHGNDSMKFEKVWKVTDTDINNFLAAYYAGGSTFANYSIPTDILTWPVHGPVGFDQNLSEFHDMNGDGKYNPYHGDYPKIKGTQYLRWIYTDGNVSELSNMGLEFRVSMFACTGNTMNSPLNRSVFVEYEIINRNSYYYKDFRVGLVNSFMIGCHKNDNFRSNALANAIQKYNSNTYFNACDESQYAPHLNMVQGVGLIAVNNSQEPKLASSLLNMRFNVGLQDGIQITANLFNYHNAKFKNGVPVTFGNSGYDTSNTLLSKYMFPGNSDPNNWGTDGIQAPYTWTYENYNNTQSELTPSSSFDFINSGPFKLGPNEKIKLAFVYVTTQDSTLNSEELLELNANQIIEMRTQYQNNQLACAASILDMQEQVQVAPNAFPNPTDGLIRISSPTPIKQIRIMGISGSEIMSCKTCNEIDLQLLRPGIYMMEYESEGQKFVEKIIKK